PPTPTCASIALFTKAPQFSNQLIFKFLNLFIVTWVHGYIDKLILGVICYLSGSIGIIGGYDLLHPISMFPIIILVMICLHRCGSVLLGLLGDHGSMGPIDV